MTDLPDGSPSAAFPEPEAGGHSRRIAIIAVHSRLRRLPLSWATGLSVGFHIFAPILLTLLTLAVLFLLSMLWNIPWQDWFKEKQAKQDVEFTLVQDRQAPRPIRAKFRGEFNQQAGGQPKPKKPPAPLERASDSAAAARAAKQAQTTASPPKTPAAEKPPIQKPPQAKKTPPSKPTQAAAIPLPSEKKPTTAPAEKSEKPAQKPTQPHPDADKPTAVEKPSTEASESQPSDRSEGASAPGNAEAGPAKTPGVAVQQADFGPYMAELKRRLNRNWRPPRGNQNKRVVLRFDITRDGRVGQLSVDESSGDPVTDQAAMAAVRMSAPFKPLPSDFQGDSVPILFTFDYTVFGNPPPMKHLGR